MKVKTLKISEEVHKQVKVYAANAGIDIATFVEKAILNELKKKK